MNFMVCSSVLILLVATSAHVLDLPDAREVTYDDRFEIMEKKFVALQAEMENLQRQVQQKSIGNLQTTQYAKEDNSTYYPTSTLNLVELGGKKYFFSKIAQATWIEALSFCRAFGMDLVSIESQAENDLLNIHLESIGLKDLYVWTSANKIGRSTYLWVNGEYMIFEDWFAGQPNAPATEHCMFLYRSDWHDGGCFMHNYSGQNSGFICEERV